MEESDTYLMIVDEGQEKALRELILGQGEDRFGTPDASVKSVLAGISDLDRLKRISRQMWKASNWQAILDIP